MAADPRRRTGRGAGSASGRKAPSADTDSATARVRFADRAALFLEGQPPGVSSLILAREVLGLRGGTEESCEALLLPLLHHDSRFEHERGRGWRLGEPVPEGTAPSPRDWPWTVWAVEDRAAAALRIENGRVVSHVSAEGAAGFLPPPAAGRLFELARGSNWVFADGRGALSALRRHRPIGAELPQASEALSLPGLAECLLPPPPPRDVAAIAARLGLGPVIVATALGRARAAAECFLALLEDPRISRASRIDEILAVQRRTAVRPDLSGRMFDESYLRSLPETAGIYRFFDDDDRVLYVGKARNLRRRVQSYFAARSRPDKRTAPWEGRIHRIEIEPTASEMEALLREAAAIARTLPPHNRQRTVHSRARPSAGNLILLLPSHRAGEVRAHLIRNGVPLARVTIGPRGGGSGKLGERIRALYFDPGSGPRPFSASAQREAPCAQPGEEGRANRELLASWLARQEGLVPAFDPTDAAGPEEALSLALRYARSVAQGERDVLHRAPGAGTGRNSS